MYGSSAVATVAATTATMTTSTGLAAALAIPLQLPGPGPSLGVLGVINLLLAVVVGYLVYRDAQSRSTDNEVLWAVGMGLASLLLSFVGFILAVIIYYIVVVRE